VRILFLSRWYPFPPDNGSKIRILNVLRQLSRRHEVTLLAFHDQADRVDATTLGALREYCRDVRAFPFRDYCPNRLGAIAGLLSLQPRSLVDTFSRGLAEAMNDELRTGGFDLVIASEFATLPYAITQRYTPVVLEDLELTVFHEAMERAAAPAQRLRARLTWLKLRSYLRSALPHLAACTVVSEKERALLRAVSPDYDRVTVLPNAVDVASYADVAATPRPNTLIFAGALTYRANYDAIEHFLRAIQPLVLHDEPGAVLRVTGGYRGIDLSELPPSPAVEYTGYVDDVRPVIAESWVSVVPLRVGGGTRL
jgi:polysaccharide biosynthesis protein PslH